jgi:hypothetical protein
MTSEVVIAEGGLNLLREISRYLGARGISAEIQRPPPGACSSG